MFDSYFNHNIRDLLGFKRFWSRSKRCPDPAEFNPNDAIHIGFVSACANLIAFNLGVEQVRDIEVVRSVAASCKGQPYVK